MKTLCAWVNRKGAILAAASFFGFLNTASAVWINEFHYDNVGTDIGEFVEIAGVAGTDLSGWSLVLYNGANDLAGVVYNTVALSGVVDNQSNGYGTIAFGFPSNGIQNGPRDGFALINPLSAVVQFLSYEGSFVASGGPAQGMTSTNIGVSETESTPVGFSLQLIGMGSSYSDFSWAGPVEASVGSLNVGQTFRGTSVPDAGSSLALFGLAVGGLGFLRRRAMR